MYNDASSRKKIGFTTYKNSHQFEKPFNYESVGIT